MVTPQGLTQDDCAHLTVDIEAPDWRCGADIPRRMLATISALRTELAQAQAANTRTVLPEVLQKRIDFAHKMATSDPYWREIVEVVERLRAEVETAKAEIQALQEMVNVEEARAQDISIMLETAKAERDSFKWRLWGRKVSNAHHGTHCGIWGNDGLGTPIEGADLHCTCGAQENFNLTRALTAESALSAASENERRLREALKECSDDLASFVDNEYGDVARKYPGMARKYERDMEPVLNARKLLEEKP